MCIVTKGVIVRFAGRSLQNTLQAQVVKDIWPDCELSEKGRPWRDKDLTDCKLTSNSVVSNSPAARSGHSAVVGGQADSEPAAMVSSGRGTWLVDKGSVLEEHLSPPAQDHAECQNEK